MLVEQYSESGNLSMTSASEGAVLLQELERAEQILGSLLQRLSNLHTSLESIESNLRVDDFSTTVLIVQGSTTGIVCALTADIKGDPIHDAFESLRGRGFRLPVIIKGSDRSESQATCDSIMRIIRAQLKLKTSQLIINLRWSPLPTVIDSNRAVILGTRYKHGSPREISTFKEKLRELNLQVLDDDGEFGGGLLTYKLTELAREAENVVVLEMTLSSTLAGNVPKIAEILETITTL
ncbi:MAG: hypothetical protein C4K48_02945 [Candidatus Thorarchaeota archaeon]|nr:MAG: hypothetical protein C4K48_02945 [Candidatus Thorarchaeota archaeon]